VSSVLISSPNIRIYFLLRTLHKMSTNTKIYYKSSLRAPCNTHVKTSETEYAEDILRVKNRGSGADSSNRPGLFAVSAVKKSETNYKSMGMYKIIDILNTLFGSMQQHVQLETLMKNIDLNYGNSAILNKNEQFSILKQIFCLSSSFQI
jgi:NAD+--asparagine ADP-ribosyltransferase